jgi:Flp pilus assembly protein TadD
MNRVVVRWRAIACAALLAGLAPVALAVDVPNRNPPVEDRAMREARAAVKEGAWERALALLQPFVQAQPDDADAHNLLGYSLRKLQRHAESEAAYGRALALDPGHLGAHEYLGELMIILGRRDRALHHLRELERLCGTGCEEYQELRRAFDAAPAPTPAGAPRGRW